MKKNSFKDKLRDVVYEKMKYSVEKHSQIVAQLRVLTDKHGNLLFRTILLFNATMTRKWCYLWMGLYEWLARIPICAFYSSSDKPNTDYNKALKIIFDNKDDLKPLYYEKERNYEFMVFYSTNLLSHIRKHSDDEEVRDILHDIANGLVYKCSRCGCGIVGTPFYTYRSNNGCVGRKYECHVCRGYDNETAHNISKYREKHGSKATIMKVLKNESQMEDVNEKEE